MTEDRLVVNFPHAHSFNETDYHAIAEILLKVTLNTKTLNIISSCECCKNLLLKTPLYFYLEEQTFYNVILFQSVQML